MQHAYVGPFIVTQILTRIRIADSTGEAMWCERSHFEKAVGKEVKDLTGADADAVFTFYKQEF